MQNTQQEMSLFRKQKTIAGEACFSGVGIHTGQEVSLRFCPADPGKGVFFKRVDLPGAPIIPATFEYVFDTSRSTNIALQDIKIYTIEHVLAAVRAFEIDNLCIELSGIEPPAGNGSSDVFVELIENAGVKEQEEKTALIQLTEPVYYSDGDIHIVALPSHEYRISYTLHYPNSQALGTQFHSVVVNKENFKNEIAPCRTFALYEELSYLMDRGLIKGGSLDNAVVIKDQAVISKNGLFFPNEMVRHKILDAIGDFSLVGMHFLAHIIAIRSGHAANFQFAKKLFNRISESSCELRGTCKNQDA
jgi:UDP-3-O-[3-hydroxymyristoyl] N-acetylglucosamine deacetylase